MTSRPFQVDLSGLVGLLSEHLYSGPQVFVRELLQNGVDAVSARRQIESHHAGHITIRVADGESLTVVDDGIGLTHDEAADLLATIGASSKRGDLETARSTFIGQFGVGLLSCFLVSDEITVVTRSMAAAGAPPVRWVGRSNGTFTLETITGDDVPAGSTSVTLRARPDAAAWFDADTVARLARRYGGLLPVPVTVEGARQRDTVTMGDPTIINAIDDFTSASLAELVDALEAMGQTALGTIIDMLEAIGYTNVRSLAEALDDATSASYRRIAEALDDFTSASFNAIGDALRRAGASFATVVDALDWATNASVNQIANAIRYAGATFTQVMQALEDELSVNRYDTAAQIDRLGANIIEILEALVAVYDAGFNSLVNVLVSLGVALEEAIAAVTDFLFG